MNERPIIYAYCHYRCGPNATEAWKGEILLRTWDEDGNDVVKRFPHASTVYYENANGEFTGVYGNSLSRMEFDSIFSKKRWKDEYGIKRTYGEFAPDMEYLQDTFYGFNKNPEFFKHDLRVCVLDIETAIKRGAGEESFDATACHYPINLISLYDSGEDLTHVFMYLNTKWYNKPESERPWKDSKKVKFHIYTHYHEMLNSFLVWWQKNTPHVVTGWNIKYFDIPYIVNECRKVLASQDDIERGIDMVANHLSPMNELVERSDRTGWDGSHTQFYQIAGVNILDYKDLYIQYDTKNEAVNYKLETVCQLELGIGKYENPTSNFYRFYTEYWEEFVEYNIIDTHRVWELEQKLKFIELAKTVAYTSLIPIEKVFVTTPVVIGALNQEVRLNERVMITSTGMEDVAQEYEGAFVKDPLRGIYSEGVFSIDLNSLYPNIMITLNLSNETYVGKIVEEDDHGVTINLNGKPRKMNWTQFNQKLKPRVNRAANNALFLKHTEKEGVMPKFLKKTYNNRRDTKNKMIDCNNKIAKLKDALKVTEDKDKRKKIKTAIEQLDSMSKQFNANQTAFKLLMNSLYGLFANPYSPIFNTILAEAITISGQEIIKLSGDFIDKYAKETLKCNQPVTIYSDTDSAYVNAEPFLKHKFGEDIKWTKQAVQDYCDYLDAEIVSLINKNCEKIVKDEFWSDISTIEFKRETMCSHGAFVAKKRYCLLVRNDEGTPVKKWKYIGLDVKKNEYTKETKQSISETIEQLILENWENSQFSEHIYKLWDEFQTRTPEQVGVIKGYNTFKQYYGGFRSEPGTLAHVRALHYYNDIVKQRELGLAELRFKEKLQYVFVKPNENEFHIDVIGFDFDWPKEFDEMFEVDYRELFTRTIIKPLKQFIELKHYVVPNVEQKEVFDINEL